MNYYNEHDPKAAAWLRELIRQGHIPFGRVDERDIQQVNAKDLENYTQCHFFAGIGGWSLALHTAGWPDDRPVWTGSCPCQPFSAAGKGLGTADERHLWPEFARLIGECQPPEVFGEQVASAAGRLWLAGVRADLEGMGYAVGAADLCSAGVGSPNIRQRIYWMADASGERLNGGAGMRGQTGRTIAQASGVGCDRLEHPESDGRQQRGTESGERGIVGGCSLGRLADADAPARRADDTGRDNTAGENAGREESDLQFGANREAGRLADSGGGQSGHGGLQPGGQYGQQPQDRGSGGMGQSESDGCEVREHVHSELRGERLGEGRILSGPYGFWSPSELLPCTDGKPRRVEPGSFPLAHGVSGRVGLLRGYGNAINPQLAAEFIQACEEARLLNDLIG